MKKYSKCLNKPLYPLNVGEKLFLDGFGVVTVEHINSNQLSFPINVAIGAGRINFDWDGKGYKKGKQVLYKLCNSVSS